MIDLTAAQRKACVGDKLLLVPGHCDPTVNLHDWYIGVRGLHSSSARVEVVWPVAARGAVFLVRANALGDSRNTCITEIVPRGDREGRQHHAGNN